MNFLKKKVRQGFTVHREATCPLISTKIAPHFLMVPAGTVVCIIYSPETYFSSEMVIKTESPKRVVAILYH